MQELADHKQTARMTWATGDYDAMMRTEGLYAVGHRLTEAVGIAPGERVLDVACGTGNAAIPAAQAGGKVVGLDLTPELLDVAQQRADEAGAEVDLQVGDAEELPFAAASFDIVVSTFGCMFAPRHEIVASELARVLRQGGRLGLVTWTPDGAIGDFFRTAGPHMPPLPSFVDPPLACGEEPYVQELFEGTGISLRFAREDWVITHDSVDAAVECYTTMFGPLTTARRIAEAEGRWPAFRDDLSALFERLDTSEGPQVVFPAEYLVVLGTQERSNAPLMPQSFTAPGSSPG
jgi:SAM-dependent methyltransferase